MRPKGSEKTPGSGRKKGTPNKRTLELKAMAEQQVMVRTSENGPEILPLDVMLGTMNALWHKALEFDAEDDTGWERRVDYMRQAAVIAAQCAPYKHPRLNAVAMTEVPGIASAFDSMSRREIASRVANVLVIEDHSSPEA